MNILQLYETRNKIRTFLIRAEFASLSLGFDNALDYLRFSLDHPHLLEEMYHDHKKETQDEKSSENVSVYDRNLENKLK